VDKWDKKIVSQNYETILDDAQCTDLVATLLKIQDTVKFFKAHLLEFKKGDVYLRRYETLRERIVLLSTNLVLKTIKEALQKINLKLLHDSSQNLEKYFHMPSGHEMCKKLMTCGLDN
jgi:hypothetical protein